MDVDFEGTGKEWALRMRGLFAPARAFVCSLSPKPRNLEAFQQLLKLPATRPGFPTP